MTCPRQGDLAGQLAVQLPQRGDLARVRLRQAQAVQPRLPVHAEQVRMGDRDAELGQHGVHLVPAGGAEPDQLVPVAGQLAQLPDLRRREPRLRQPAHPQQAGQVRGVPLIVLDPAVGERLDPQRMGQVHLRARFLEHVRGPVPAVGGPGHHPRVLSGLGDLAPQRGRAAGDPHGLQLAAVLGHPDDHAAPPVQVDPDDLPAVIRCIHRRASFAWWRRMLCTFQHPPGAEARSFIASREVTLDLEPLRAPRAGTKGQAGRPAPPRRAARPAPGCLAHG
jgi:hypothetical protein